MAEDVYAFSIRKSIPWRGSQQGFSNLYHYQVAVPTEGALNVFLTKLKDLEAPVHSTAVTFEEGRAWGPVNEDGRGGRMVSVVDFSGTGSATPATSMYKECAFLLQWPLGRYGTRNRPQFLRKWIHSNYLFGKATTVQDGSSSLGSMPTELGTYEAAVRDLLPVPPGPTYRLISASGHTADQAAVMKPYLEHRQFG